jgi:hypothetical protein
MTRLVGLAFCIGGFVAIALGWSGAAGKDCTECQMPYLLSGGAAGLGLIVFGVGMMIMAQLRTEGRRLAERLEQWRSASVPSETPTAPDAAVPSAPPAMDEHPATREVTSEDPAAASATGGPPVVTPAGPG